MIAPNETSPHTKMKGKIFPSAIAWFLLLGGFLVFQTGLMGQADLELYLVPLHIALVGLQSTLLLAGLGAGAPPFEVLGLMTLSGLFAWGLVFLHGQGIVFWMGWFLFVVLSSRAPLMRLARPRPVEGGLG